MHGYAARIEPAIDRQAVALSDSQHGLVRGILARCLRKSGLHVDGSLFPFDLPPVAFSVGFRAPLRLLVGVAAAPALLRFLFVLSGLEPVEDLLHVHSITP